MKTTLTLVIILSGFTIFNSVAVSFLNITHTAISFPVVGRIGIWTIIVVYIGAVVDISIGSRIFQYIWTHRKVRKWS